MRLILEEEGTGRVEVEFDPTDPVGRYSSFGHALTRMANLIELNAAKRFGELIPAISQGNPPTTTEHHHGPTQQAHPDP